MAAMPHARSMKSRGMPSNGMMSNGMMSRSMIPRSVSSGAPPAVTSPYRGRTPASLHPCPFAFDVLPRDQPPHA